MTPDRWGRVTELMHLALDVAPADRRAWLEHEGGGDAALVAEVTRLLEAHDGAGRFLEDPAIAEPDAAGALRDAFTRHADGGVRVGGSLGQYRILREVGRGGMGTVYLGVRSDDVFDKEVAIKVVPGALVSESLRERFERERRVLATLDHPGIARVLDGGATTDGLPFLILEYVDGVPIDTYCETRRLSLPDRLRLFLEVCRAVHFAHGRLIVHRDIKANNVLVGTDGRARLLDFGIAKLLAPDALSGDARATVVQAWTPESASPEQVRGEATTIATDIYGLGALLYRLLTGRPVFDLADHHIAERARIICEVAPQRPSVEARQNGLITTSSAASDLDLIVLKALQKEPSRRYHSAEHLAEDVERHLAHRPVLAAPDSLKYRAQRFISRHPAATAGTLVAAVLVMAATSAAFWQAERARDERDRAQARLMDVRRMANTLIFDVYDRVENSQNATSIRRGLVEKGLAYLRGLDTEAATDPVLAVELARAYGRLARVQGARGQANLGDREGAMKSLEKGRSLLTPFLADNGTSLDLELVYLSLTRDLASNQRSQQLTSEGLHRARALQARYPDNDSATEALAHTVFFAALEADNTDQELPLWTEANQSYRILVERYADDPSHLRNLALTEKYIGAAQHELNRLDLARPHYERALELDRRVQKLRPENRQTTIDLAFDLGNIASLDREAVPPRLAEAAALYRESLTLRERAAALDPADVFARQSLGYCLLQLSVLSRELGDLVAAESYGRRSVDVYESLPSGEDLARRGYAWLALGKAIRAAGHEARGCAALRRAESYFSQASVAPNVERNRLEAGTLSSAREALAACR
jgi:non-specific serine/threonine protein kinase/serine/threonine-protein kinase